MSKLPAVAPTYNGTTPYVSAARLAAFADQSGHGNHASFIQGYNTCCPPMPYQPPMVYQPYILRPGVNADEVAGGGSPWECSCHFPEGHYPIDTATGEFWHTFDDIAIAGRGPGIDLQRTYSSHDAGLVGRFGAGWTDTYAESLNVNGSIVTIKAGNGSAVTFSNNAGTYTAAGQVLASLVNGPNSTYVFTDKAKTQHTFNAAGQLTQITDRNGYSVTLTYDTNTPSRLATIADQWGRSVTLTYSGTGTLVQQAQDSAGRTVTYGYTGNDLTQVTDIGGGISSFTYDANNLLLTMKDPTCTAAGASCNGGNGLQNTYTNGQVTKQVDYMGRATNYDYTSVPFTTKVTDPRGNITLYEYVGGFLFSTTKEDSSGNALATTTYGYAADSLGAAVVVDPNGHTTTTVRDGQANLLSVTDALGRTTTSTYNTFNEPLVVTDASGVQTTNTYDGNGNLTQTSRPLVGSSPAQSQTVVYTYGDVAHPGDLTQMTDADGKLWHYAYESHGYRNSETDPLGDQTTHTYDTVGRLTAKVTPKGNVAGCGCAATYTTSYTVNAWGQPLTATNPLLYRTTYTYDGDQRLTSVLDANNHTTTYKYDLDGEQTEVDRQDGTKLLTGYDVAGNVQSQTDGLNHATSYGYDALNRKTSMTDALNRATAYGYDAAGNLTSLTDGKGQTTSYAYDAGDQLVSISYSDNRTPNVSFSYNALGERLSMADGSGSTSYSYDSLKRLTQSTNGAGAQLKYGYDLKGQLTSIVYPGTTGTVNRTYDDAGRLSTLQDWLSHTTTIKYDANSNIQEQDYPNSVVETLGYNAADQLTSITDAVGATQLLNFSYTRDPIGQLGTDGAKGYGYDGINRLTTYTSGPSNGITYGYDNADRLSSSAIQGGNTTVYAYDNADQLQTATITNGGTQVGSKTYTFDANGNRSQVVDQSQNKTTYAYDQANRLTAYNASASYSYNGDGLRISKTVSGTTTNQTWDTAEGLPLVVQDGSTSYVAGPGGLPLEQITGTTVYYFHADQLGSTRALTDSTGTVQQTYDYDPYGNLASSTGTISNPFQYAGQYLDSESGLVYLRARYYDASVAAFVTRDPITARTREPYAYVMDNPLNGSDPSGLVVAGVCGNVSWQFVVAIHASACALVGFNTNTHAVSFGFSQTVTTPGENGVPNAIGTPSMGAGYGGEFSWDAQDVSQMSNSFVYAGGSAAGFSGEYFASTPGSSCPVHGVALGRSYGTPWPEIHGGISETVVEKVGWPPRITGLYT